MRRIRRFSQSNVFLMVTLGLFSLVILLLLSLPLAALVLTSFQSAGSRGLSLTHYRTLFAGEAFSQALLNSLSLSLQSSVIAVVIATPIVIAMLRSGNEKLQRAMLLLVNLRANFHGAPLVLAGTLLIGGSGLVTRLFASLGATLPFKLATPQGLLILYVYFQIPLAILLLYPVFLGIQRDWRQAAAVLGAYSHQFWFRIGLPITLPSLLTSFAVLFAHAMGAYATAYQLSLPHYPLLTLAISDYVSSSQQSNPGLGCALAVMLVIALVISILLGEWAGGLADKRRARS